MYSVTLLLFADMQQIALYWLLQYSVDIESFWTEGYAGQIPNSGHELEIYVLWLL